MGLSHQNSPELYLGLFFQRYPTQPYLSHPNMHNTPNMAKYGIWLAYLGEPNMVKWGNYNVKLEVADKKYRHDKERSFSSSKPSEKIEHLETMQ